MALVTLGGAPSIIGVQVIPGTTSIPGSSTVVLDAANEACIMFGQIYTDDGASHTIDTTGSSAVEWRSGAVTFANAGSTFKVGLATIDTTNGPPARATNVADVITYSVSKTMTGGGGAVTANAWQTHVPDAGTMTVGNGDYIALCMQVTARGGADSVTITYGNVSGILRPGVTTFIGAVYANGNGSPDGVIRFSDGTRGYFVGSTVFNTISSQSWNSGSATKEYGNLFTINVPVKVYGVYASCNIAGDTDFILYSDPLGTPVAEKSVSVDANAVSASNTRWSPYYFSSPYSITAGQAIAAIAKPTTVTNVAMAFKSFNAAEHQGSEPLGANGYAVNRASGAFAAQNSNKDRFAIGLLVGAFDDGASVGGMLVHPGMNGRLNP